MVLRQRFWIDNKVQGVLIGRVILYWAFGLVYLGIGSACFQYCQHPDWSFSQHASALIDQCGPWVPCLILILPLVIFDVVRMSNLFAGPIFRLRRHVLTMVKDPECRPLTFREDDYWQDLVEPVNQLQLQILTLRKRIVELELKKNALDSEDGENTERTRRTIDGKAGRRNSLRDAQRGTDRSRISAPADSESLAGPRDDTDDDSALVSAAREAK